MRLHKDLKKNVLTHVTLLKFDDRLPLRKTVSSLERHYGLTLTNVEVLKITNRVANKLAIPYKLLIKKIREAKVVYVDETAVIAAKAGANVLVVSSFIFKAKDKVAAIKKVLKSVK